MVFTPDMRLADRYRLDTRIGLGGMSEVWRASDELLGRPVAIKALASPLAADPALRAGTRREARAAARLTHPHVTQVYDYGEAAVPGGATVPYLVMELVDGQNLADRLSHGPLPWRDAVRVAAQVAAGLAAAHKLGVIHRDIKPGNVMLTATGAKVLDFGIATLSGARPETDSGWLFGTPAYAAPERLRAGAADPAGDVYALGALLYESLTGYPPIAAASWDEAAAAHQRGERPRPLVVPGLPATVATLCLSCLAPDPAGRPPVGEVAERLAAASGGPDVTSAGLTPTVGMSATRAAHPPTLIDRSLTGPAHNQPPAHSQPQSAQPRVGGERIAASAAVVHRAPAPAYDVNEAGPARSTRRPDRSRLAIVGGAGAVIAAGLALTLIAAAFRAEPHQPNAAPPPATTSASPPAATTAPPVRPAPTTDEGAVAEFDLLLTELGGSGQIDADVVRDLRDKLEDVREKLDDRKRKGVRDEARALLKEIHDHRDEGAITPEVADRLAATLEPLLDNSGPGNGRNDE